MSPAGVGQSLCFDLLSSPGKGPLVQNDPELLKKMAGIKSLTITCWVKRPANFDDVSNDAECLLSCPGVFDVRFDKWGRLSLIMTGADKSRKQIRNDWVSIGHISPDNRWVFLAFTYDGTKQGPNAAFYYGYEPYQIKRESFKTADAGKGQTQPDAVWTEAEKVDAAAGMLSLSQPASLVIGAGKPDGKQKVQGALDAVKIFASSADGSAALDQVEIENIRRGDLGAEYVRKQESQILEAKRGKEMDLMRLEDKYWSAGLNLHRVDPLNRIFSNKCPPPVGEDFVPCVPKGGALPVMFAAMYRGTDILPAQIVVSAIKSESGVQVQLPFTSYEIVQVPVEANNNGGVMTTLDTRPPEFWKEYLIGEAPFKIAEALRETKTLNLRINDRHDTLYNGILLDFDIPQNTKPGLYRGS
ncbi:MAG: hypothetical protein WCG03_06055, partial [Kiritimatiellales bacterium]